MFRASPINNQPHIASFGCLVEFVAAPRRRERDDADDNDGTVNDHAVPDTQSGVLFAALQGAAAAFAAKHGDSDASVLLRFRVASAESIAVELLMRAWRATLAAVQTLKRVTSMLIDFERCSLTDDHLALLFLFDDTAPHFAAPVTSLLLAGNAASAAFIRDVLPRSPVAQSLLHLGVTNNPLGSQGLAELTALIRTAKLPCLTKLHATRIGWTSGAGNPGALTRRAVRDFVRAVDASKIETVYFKQNDLATPNEGEGEGEGDATVTFSSKFVC